MRGKIIATLMTLLLVVGLTPVLAVDVGTGVGVGFGTEAFAPKVFVAAESRVVTDDNVPTGRNVPGENLGNSTATLSTTRTNNYAFEGEKVTWNVLAFDRNGIETTNSPVITLGTTQGTGNTVEALCLRDAVQLASGTALTNFGARDLNSNLTFDSGTMRTYTCTLSVESPASMSDEFWVAAEVSDTSGLSNTFTPNEFWFFNPVIALDINGALDFGVVRPGTDSYSTTLTVGNDASPGSGVLLEMFISGTDFHDPVSSAAKCPVTNELGLDNFRYLATSGGRSSRFVNPTLDTEGYDAIPRGIRITEAQEVIGGDAYAGDADVREAGNVLAPGAEQSVTLKLSLPNPCVGDFTDGQIYFWGLAV